MFLDPRPEITINDLFDKEKQKRLLSALTSKVPLILLLGIRRVGKTSLLKAVLSELDKPYIFLDAKSLEEGSYSKAILYQMLAKEFSELSSQWKELAKFLGHIKGVHVARTYIEFE